MCCSTLAYELQLTRLSSHINGDAPARGSRGTAATRGQPTAAPENSPLPASPHAAHMHAHAHAHAHAHSHAVVVVIRSIAVGFLFSEDSEDLEAGTSVGASDFTASEGAKRLKKGKSRMKRFKSSESDQRPMMEQLLSEVYEDGQFTASSDANRARGLVSSSVLTEVLGEL